ncbi:Nif11-like leader peptide family natural product precursor [Nonomuraea sp. NPDC052265]|uniref:Nif11-like leader peptide family natural product precursor n=1 Tax=Nonomuraea sp. NPDC052265 TaxID=3364374 RepID=UPI0037CBFB16
MSGTNLIAFLRLAGSRADVLESLKARSKAEVIAAAAEHGLPFSEADFDGVVWELEERLADLRGDAFDATFPLWRTMWGQHYLEFLVGDLLPALERARLLEPS